MVLKPARSISSASCFYCLFVYHPIFYCISFLISSEKIINYFSYFSLLGWMGNFSSGSVFLLAPRCSDRLQNSFNFLSNGEKGNFSCKMRAKREAA